MNRTSIGRTQPLLRSLIDYFSRNEKRVEAMKVISLGCMFGTAMASPFLFEESRNTWPFDVFLFFLSSGAFMWQNQLEIKTYGPFTIGVALFLGLAAYSSARTPLKELLPWLPTAICLLILFTVHFFPKLRQACNEESNQPQRAMEEGRSFPFPHSSGSSVEPGSIQSDEDIRSQGRFPDPWIARALETSHMDGVGRSISPPFGSNHDSDIELESLLNMAAYQGESNAGNLPKLAFDIAVLSQRLDAAGPSSVWNPPQDNIPRSLSPEPVGDLPTNTEDSQSPLLG